MVYRLHVRSLPSLCCALLAACGGPPGVSDGAVDGRAAQCEPQPAVRDPVLDPGSLAGVDRAADPACTGAWVVGVEGRVETPSGEGIAGARTQICVVPVGGELLCLAPPTTDASGAFQAAVAEPSARCAARMTLRVLLPGSINATSYCELELAPSDGVLTLADPIVVFPVERPACLPPEGDETEPRTITLADGLELVDLRPEQTNDYDELAAGRHDLSGHCLLARAPAGGFLGAYGFRPEVDVLGGVAVRIPNTTGLAPDTSVDLYVLGGLATSLADGTHVEEGEWARFGTGTVSADGARIDSDRGALLTALTWLAYRLPGGP